MSATGMVGVAARSPDSMATLMATTIEHAVIRMSSDPVIEAKCLLVKEKWAHV
jgi:hypothetical protein